LYCLVGPGTARFFITVTEIKSPGQTHKDLEVERY